MRKVYAAAIAIAVLMLTVNLIGVFQPDRPAWVVKETPGLFVDDLTLNQQEAFTAVKRLPAETDTEYALRLTNVIYHALLYPPNDAAEAWIQPYDGWLLWLAAQTGRTNGRAFADWRRNLARGVGECSIHAYTLVGLLNDAGIEAYVVTRVHHVYATANLDGQWWVLDPTYGVTIPHDVRTAQRDPALVEAAYRDATTRQRVLFDDEPALDAVVRVMTDSWAGIAPIPLAQEQALVAAGWLLPLVLLAIGLQGYKHDKH